MVRRFGSRPNEINAVFVNEGRSDYSSFLSQHEGREELNFVPGLTSGQILIVDNLLYFCGHSSQKWNPSVVIDF